MKGLNDKGIKSLENMIKLKFDNLSMRFIGIIPQKATEKSIIFKTSKESLISLFLKALGTKDPNKLEERTLKTMLNIANGYMNALRDRTTSRVINDVDSYIRNQNSKKQPISANKIQEKISTELDKAGKHLKLIANAETNKAANVGTALQISRIGQEKKIEDPIVFFVVTHDDVTGPEEYVLHTLPDRITPRVWKLSEIGHEYHKKGDPNPKFPGLHPNCRCKLTALMPGWGFNEKGGVQYKGPKWDEFEYQREKYGLPR